MNNCTVLLFAETIKRVKLRVRDSLSGYILLADSVQYMLVKLYIGIYLGYRLMITLCLCQ